MFDLDRRSLPIPDPPKEGYTYAIDGPTGRPVKSAPAGRCGKSCPKCWPEEEDE